MCNFCELEPACGDARICVSSLPNGVILDGSQNIGVYMNRYISESENVHENTLVLNLSVDLEDANYSVKETQVKIKYCPFCGEEL